MLAEIDAPVCWINELGGRPGMRIDLDVRPREPCNQSSHSIPMTRYLWHFDANGWPLERIDTLTGENVLVLTGGPEETLHPEEGGWPLACSIPKVSGVAWVFDGDGHPREAGTVLGGMLEGGAGEVARKEVV